MLLDPFRVQFKCLLLGEGILKLSFLSEWPIPSSVFPEPLAGLEHDHRSLTSWPNSHDCFPYHRLFFGGQTYHLSFSSGMTPNDFYGRHSHLLNWVEFLLFAQFLASLWPGYLTFWGLGFLPCKLGAVKNTAGEHSSTTMFHSFKLDNIKIDINTEVYTVTSSFFQVRKLSREDLGNFV